MHFFWEGPFCNIFQNYETVLTIFYRRRQNFNHILPQESYFDHFFYRRRHNFDRSAGRGSPSEPLWREALMQMHHLHHLKAAPASSFESVSGKKFWKNGQSLNLKEMTFRWF
jgi:hypothetical protein